MSSSSGGELVSIEDFLAKHGKNHVDKKWFSNHAFLKYPLLVNQRHEFMQNLTGCAYVCDYTNPQIVVPSHVHL